MVDEARGRGVRYTVTFAHSRYLRQFDEYLGDGREYPEGVSRMIAVTVEADNPEEALQVACDRLGWPDHEIDMIPYAIDSEMQARGRIDQKLASDALLSFWRRNATAPERLLESLDAKRH
jgi:hypothetical protein